MLHQLGINSTVFVQFLIYVVTFPLLVLVVYTPFVKAMEERKNRTKGTEEIAQDYKKKSIELHSEYQTLARHVRDRIQSIYQKMKSEASQEYEQVVGKAKAETQAIVEENRRKISTEMKSAKDQLKGQATTMALSITQKLLGKS